MTSKPESPFTRNPDYAVIDPFSDVRLILWTKIYGKPHILCVQSHPGKGHAAGSLYNEYALPQGEIGDQGPWPAFKAVYHKSTGCDLSRLTTITKCAFGYRLVYICTAADAMDVTGRGAWVSLENIIDSESGTPRQAFVTQGDEQIIKAFHYCLQTGLGFCR